MEGPIIHPPTPITCNWCYCFCSSLSKSIHTSVNGGGKIHIGPWHSSAFNPAITFHLTLNKSTWPGPAISWAQLLLIQWTTCLLTWPAHSHLRELVSSQSSTFFPQLSPNSPLTLMLNQRPPPGNTLPGKLIYNATLPPPWTPYFPFLFYFSPQHLLTYYVFYLILFTLPHFLSFLCNRRRKTPRIVNVFVCFLLCTLYNAWPIVNVQ